MPSPTSSSSSSHVGQATSLSINALISGDKWGGVTGTGVTLTYSFPWTSSGTATFSGHNGIGDYSTLNEQNASSHYGLSMTQQAAVRSALQSWANVANIVFAEVAETSSNVGDIRFAWTSAPNLTGTNVQAWGWAGYPDSSWPNAGDVWISTLSSGAIDPDWSAGSYNFNSLIHELGHALGLKHPFEESPILSGGQDSRQYTVMSYTNHPHSLFVQVTHNANGSVSFRSFYVQPDTPMLYDVAAMQFIYGANLSYKTGNDAYTFDPNTPFFRTIWDAGGTDTISVSNFTKGCVIDLQQGHFSNITIESDSTAGYNWNSLPPQATYDGTDNLAIAYGSVIENAIGGGGNDTLIGNDANNSLDGGGGNDTINGGAGNDTFDWDASSRVGNDVFYGGTGDDIFVLDSSSDTVVEYAQEGTDTIWVDFSYSLSNLPYIENLRAFGSTGVTLTGNAANNILIGSSGNDILHGGAGNDTFDWDASSRGGNDVFYGGTGDDIFVLDSSSDTVVEYAQEGTDTIWVDFSYSLGNLPYIENLGAFGSTGVTLNGNAADNILIGSSGNDTINGDAGIDAFAYISNRASHTTTKTSTGFNVSGGADGTDTLTNIERLFFSDKAVALDINGNAGTTAKLLGAVFGASSVSSEWYSKQYVGIGLSYLDGGMTYQDLMQLALNARLGAGFSNTAEVNLLYQNLVGVLPSAADLSYWVGTLTSGQFSQASLGVMAAEDNLNTTNINLVGLAQTGIEYY